MGHPSKHPKHPKRPHHQKYLSEILENDSVPITNSHKRFKTIQMSEHDTKNSDAVDFLDDRITRKILTVAEQQRLEESQESSEKQDEASVSTIRFNVHSGDKYDQNSDFDSDEDEESGSEYDSENEEENDHYMTEEQMEQLQMFDTPGQQQTLADIIMKKLDEKAREREKGCDDAASSLDPKVLDVYTQVGTYLSHYTSGKIPKPFKIIPTLVNWEQIFVVTNPDAYTPAAMYQATRLFSSKSPKMAQRFYNVYLLPRVRRNIEEYKRLNYHLYQSLKKALYKPAAFFRGILLPLAEECTAREAVIISGLLAKCSIPMLHCAVAILKLAGLQYSGSTELFIKTLIDKKFSLPFKVLEGLIAHFSSFEKHENLMPVIWHQSLLVFVQRYKHQLTSEQKRSLLDLMKKQHHHAITPEIRRELAAPAPINLSQKF